MRDEGRIQVEPGIEGLGAMIADLVKANLAAHPERVELLDGVAGRANISVTDADVRLGIVFTGSGLHIGGAHPSPDIAIECDASTLMELTTVPLRAGMPDAMTAEGRALMQKMMRRDLKVHGMTTHLKLMTRLQRLLSVA